MKNMRRLQMEISLLRNRYGSRKIAAPSDYEWVKIEGFPLLPGKFNLPACTVLIMIPDNFDSSSIKECYVDRDLKVRGSWGWENLPHLHAGYGYDQEGYRWLCFEDPRKDHAGLLDFIRTLRAYMTSPRDYVRANGG